MENSNKLSFSDLPIEIQRHTLQLLKPKELTPTCLYVSKQMKAITESLINNHVILNIQKQIYPTINKNIQQDRRANRLERWQTKGEFFGKNISYLSFCLALTFLGWSFYSLYNQEFTYNKEYRYSVFNKLNLSEQQEDEQVGNILSKCIREEVKDKAIEECREVALASIQKIRLNFEDTRKNLNSEAEAQIKPEVLMAAFVFLTLLGCLSPKIGNVLGKLFAKTADLAENFDLPSMKFKRD